MSTCGQGTKWHRNIAENFNRLSTLQTTADRQTDGRAMTNSERQREFTFANFRTCEECSNASNTKTMAQVHLTCNLVLI